jgi:hypothetical protein
MLIYRRLEKNKKQNSFFVSDDFEDRNLTNSPVYRSRDTCVVRSSLLFGCLHVAHRFSTLMQ